MCVCVREKERERERERERDRIRAERKINRERKKESGRDTTGRRRFTEEFRIPDDALIKSMGKKLEGSQPFL